KQFFFGMKAVGLLSAGTTASVGGQRERLTLLLGNLCVIGLLLQLCSLILSSTPPITLVTLSGEHGRNTLNVSVTKQAPRCFAADVARSRRTIRSSARSVG